MTVTRRIVSEERTVQCDKNIKKYINKTNGVDLVDYPAKIGGGWAQIGHFKKWYTKVHHAVTDFMIHQGCVGWNMSCNNRNLCQGELSMCEFQAVLAKEWISFVNESQQYTTSKTIKANALDLVMTGH